MSKYIPVDPEKWAAMVQAQSENARLKAEVERLTALVESNLNSSKVAMGKADAVLHERDSLKAEVERLTKAHSDALADFWAIHKGYFDLKAEVEQLRKEGKQP